MQPYVIPMLKRRLKDVEHDLDELRQRAQAEKRTDFDFVMIEARHHQQRAVEYPGNRDLDHALYDGFCYALACLVVGNRELKSREELRAAVRNLLSSSVPY